MRNKIALCKNKVTWDNYVISVTIAITLFLFYVAYKIISAYMYDKDILLVFAFLILTGVILYAVLTLPISVILTNNEMIINRVFGQKVIAVNMITEVGMYKKDISDIGLFSTGGFCGIRGKFRNVTIGTYHSYVCNSKQSFLVKTRDNNNYVLSCKNHTDIIALLSTLINKIETDHDRI